MPALADRLVAVARFLALLPPAIGVWFLVIFVVARGFVVTLGILRVIGPLRSFFLDDIRRCADFLDPIFLVTYVAVLVFSVTSLVVPAFCMSL